MTDIIIYTKPDVHSHKMDLLIGDPDKSDRGEYCWDLHNLPKRFKEGDRIYFATKGFIRGYFICNYIDEGWNQIGWDSESWKAIKPIPCKAFQGFKYADKVKELKR